MSLGHEYREAESLEDIVWLVKDFGFYSKGDKVSLKDLNRGVMRRHPYFILITSASVWRTTLVCLKQDSGVQIIRLCCSPGKKGESGYTGNQCLGGEISML